MPPEVHHRGQQKERKKKLRRKKKRKLADNDGEPAFYSPASSPQAPPPQEQQREPTPPPLPQQQPAPRQHPQTVRMSLVIVPSPARAPKRGKRVATLSPAAAAAAPVPRSTAPAAGIAAAAAPAANPAAALQAAPPAGEAEQPRKRRREESGGGGKRRQRERKTLTAKGKRAAVLGVLAASELQRATAAAGVPLAQPQQQAQASQAAELGEAAADAAAAPGPGGDPGDTASLGRAWSKADISTLARLAEDRAFLVQTIPRHPPDGELDWELISRHFGRYSRGGTAVRHQYYAVVRLMKQARHEGRKGASYVDLVQAALASLPDRQGTIFDVQRVLKRDHASCLDKYRVKGAVRWKTAVREVLHDQPGLFEQAGKTATNKIIWRLREVAPA